MRVASSQQPTKTGPQSHSHKEMNSANNLKDLGNDSSPVRVLDENAVQPTA